MSAFFESFTIAEELLEGICNLIARNLNTRC